jgi:hypothetical protein
MATAQLTLTGAWAAGGRITASGDTAVFIRNTDRDPVYWAITANDTEPTIGVPDGHEVEPGAQLAMTLADTERLWFASRSGGGKITVTSGATV